MIEIDFSFSGGYANLRGSFKEKIENLPDKIASEINNILEESKIFDPNFEVKQPKNSSCPPDAFSYTLVLNKDGNKKELCFNDTTIPKALHPLIDHLRELALNKKSSS